MARNIYAIGETVLDIMFEKNMPKAATPGGSSLNTTVSLGRLSLPVHLISEWGDDPVGRLIGQFLNDNQVNTDFVYRYKQGKSSLALAFLDDDKKASYDFYKIYPQKRFDINFPEIHKDDIVLFGSFYAISLETHPFVSSFVSYARQREALLIYDPNFRKPHVNDLPHVKTFIETNIAMANVVKGSDEDFHYIFGCMGGHEAWKVVQDLGCRSLIYTRGAHGSEFFNRNIHISVPAGKVNIISTIGAGDNYNAGIVYAFIKNEVRRENLESLDQETWYDVIGTATGFAGHVCTSYENYISREFAGKYQ